MASLESLPADQRAVLQLVLQRGRSYDEIARLLSIDPSAVRQRAAMALGALGPQTGLTDERRQTITDYLLSQLDPSQAAAAHQAIASQPGERAWARVVASELSPLAASPLPEIPAAGSPPPVAPVAPPAPPSATPPPPPSTGPPAPETSPEPVGAPVPPLTPPPVPQAPPTPQAATPEPSPAAGPSTGRRPLFGRGRREKAAAAPEPKVPREDQGSGRSSRSGGAVLILLTVVIVAAVVVILLNSGSSSPSHSASVASSATTPAASTTAPAAPGSTTTAATSSAAKVVAQINLTPPSGTSKAAGIAEVLKEGTSDGIAIVGQNVPPNTTKPPNAYAVWLYNSAGDAHILGFVNPGVGANGRLSTAGGLPTNASHYKQLIVTVETKASPKTPGTIILQGTLPAQL